MFPQIPAAVTRRMQVLWLSPVRTNRCTHITLSSGFHSVILLPCSNFQVLSLCSFCCAASETVACSRLSGGGKEENSRGRRGRPGRVRGGIGEERSLARFAFHRGYIFLPFHHLRTWNRLAKQQFIFLTQEKARFAWLRRLQLDYNASRACNHNALILTSWWHVPHEFFRARKKPLTRTFIV